MDYRPLFSFLAIGLYFIAYFPYILSVRRGETKPHIFSWLIWGTTTSIVFFAQISSEGGVGAWPTGISGAINFFVGFYAYQKRGDFTIHWMDWCFFITALGSIPFWYFTSNPLWAVIVLTAVDILGFGPTLRKSFHKPFEESPLFFFLFTVSNGLIVLALEARTWTTLFFPSLMSIACLLMVLWLFIHRVRLRRRQQIA